MANKLIDSSIILCLESEEKKSAAVQSLQCLGKRPLVLVTVFGSQENANSFRETVSSNLLFDARHPFGLAEQGDHSALVDLVVGEIKSSVGE